ncbi:MAG: SpoIIE family protein phosphatase [Deltaproteobacteria bacterium]|nr:SpoIIE family protein phosphatase [Deltaproteobacteria bacterium]
MWHLLEAERYEPRLVCVPFALAMVALLIVIAYTLVMHGAPLLRATLLCYALTILPYSMGTTLASAAVDAQTARDLYRLGIAWVPLGSASAMVFQLVLAGKARATRPWIALALAGGLAWGVVGSLTDIAVSGVQWLPIGMYFFVPGRGLLFGFAFIVVVSAAGWLTLLRAYRDETHPQRRRQMSGVLWSMGLSWCGLVDVLVAFGVGWFPFAWLFMVLGVVFAVRALFFDDLLRARAVDTRAPLALVYGLAALTVGWLVVRSLRGASSWQLGLALAASYAGVRLVIATGVVLIQGERRREGPLDRVLAQLATRLGTARSIAEIATHTGDAIEVAAGVRPTLLVPASADWSWRRPDGAPVDEAATPDPLLLGWMLERGGVLTRDDLETARLADLGPALERLFDAHKALAIAPLVRRDEVVGLILVPAAVGRDLRADELRTIDRLRDRVAAALVHARMTAEAQSRVAIEREVELAAAVQAAFVPAATLHRTGALDVFGSWEPTSRCGGDWWAMYPLPDDRALVVIGDVTGHGVAAAMVTAAAKGACDAAVKLMGGDVDLVSLMARLDGAVRKVGAGRLHLTCFAALVDAPRGQVSFANAGHVVPYLCRVGATAELELHALVARGNPLGAGASPVTRTSSRGIAPGDVIVWYTDGLVESVDPEGKQFGDRRMQRLLKRLDHAHLDPESVHDAIAGAAAAHRAGRPIPDDLTLVVARVRGEARA